MVNGGGQFFGDFFPMLHAVFVFSFYPLAPPCPSAAACPRLRGTPPASLLRPSSARSTPWDLFPIPSSSMASGNSSLSPSRVFSSNLSVRVPCSCWFLGTLPSRLVFPGLNRVECVQILFKAIVPLMDSVVPVSGGTTSLTERYYRPTQAVLPP